MSPLDISALTGDAVGPSYIHSSSSFFRDTSGRCLLLRGINLSASAKVPRGHPQHVLQGFWESAEQDGLPSSNTGDAGLNGGGGSHDRHGSDGVRSLDSSVSSARTMVHDGDDNDNRFKGISYVNQTLNLQDGSADVHLARLVQWGFNVVRYVTTWEALEHEGPGVYDEEYIDYTIAVLKKLKKYGFRVYMDPHQDLFSRFTGGSGAPLWSIYACGLNPRHFTKTGAAYIQPEWPTPDAPDPASFPKMIWASNYSRFAVQTINTLFWAGAEYAPKCIIDGVNIQEYLQSHFLNAYRRLAQRIAEAGGLLDETVIGWDSINEPNHGYLGVENLGVLSKKVVLRIGPMPNPWQAIKLASGIKVDKVEKYKFGPIGPQRDGSVTIDPQGATVWMDPTAEREGLSPRYGWRRSPSWPLGICVWALHGVWDPAAQTLTQPGYFARSRVDLSREADFAADHWKAHLRRYARMVREQHREAIIFAHPPVFEIPPKMDVEECPELRNRAVFSSHFYDGLTLITKHWNWFNADALGILRGKYASVVLGLKIGEAAIRRCMQSQLSMIKQDGLENMGEFPTMMGEIGIPYDLDDKKAYKDGDYASQVRALDASLNACDGENMLNYTIWCYCPDNSHAWGDLWNGEDLSVWSPEDAAYHDSVYTVKSKRLNTQLGRPQRYRYGASNLASASAVDLTGVGHHAADAENLTRANRRPSAGSRSVSNSSASSRGGTPALDDTNLNDGARALAAFCRPYPVATVGRPTYFNFDIYKAEFELHIEYAAGDVQQNGSGGGDGSGSGRRMATEVFVPCAHFGAWPANMTQEERSSARSDPEVVGSWNAEELSLEVDVSSGDYEVQGQVLRWWYRPGKHIMKVRRRAGPIPVASARTGANGTFDVLDRTSVLPKRYIILASVGTVIVLALVLVAVR